MVPPKKYGLAHTNYDDNFVFDEKNILPPVRGSKDCINLSIKVKIDFSYSFCHRLW